MPEQFENPQIVKSLVKAIRLLKLLSLNNGGLSVNEMITALGFHRSSIQRILATFEAEGFLQRTDRPNSVYRLGAELLILGRTAVDNMGLERIARPHLERLVNLTQESAHLYVLECFHAFCISSVETSRSVRLVTSTGQNVPLHCTGVGKILLSGMNGEEVDAVIVNEGLPRITENTICDRDQIMEELANIRREGLAYDNGEFESGVRCIAAPVYNSDGQVIAAMSVNGPSYRVGPEEIPRFAVFLKNSAREFSRELGYRGQERQKPAASLKDSSP